MSGLLRQCVFSALVCLASCDLPYGQHTEPAEPILVVQGAPGELRHFPFAFDAPGGGTLISYSKHVDAVIEHPVDAVSQLGGAMTQAPNIYLSSITAASGALLGVSYFTEALDNESERSYGWVSQDGGTTWQPRLGTVRLPQPPKQRDASWGGLLFHRRTHKMPDGSVAGTLYGNYLADGEWYRSVWARSFDQGSTWDVVSTVASGPAGTEGYGEPVSALCPDGSILVVMRTGPSSHMRWTRSRDSGSSWAPARELPMVGWDPDLMLTLGGLYMSYGVPGKIWITRSQDCGETWTPPADQFIPTSSGYSALAHVGGRLVVFTDTADETTIKGYYLDAGQ